MTVKDHPAYQRLVNRAALAIGGNTLTAESVLQAAGIEEILDELEELREREQHQITVDLHRGDVRRLVRQLTVQVRLYMSPALSGERRQTVEIELQQTLRSADRALGVEH